MCVRWLGVLWPVLIRPLELAIVAVVVAAEVEDVELGNADVFEQFYASQVPSATEPAPGRYRGTARVVQSAFGIKPYVGFFGALKLNDEVTVEFEVTLPSSPAA